VCDTRPMTSSSPDQADHHGGRRQGLAGLASRYVGGGEAGYRTETIVSEFGNLDRNIYRAVAATPTPTLDEAFRKVSLVGDHSLIWLGIAGATALFGGRRGRQAAFDGVVSIAITSLVVNGALKPMLPRDRPDRELHQVIVARHVPLPASTSFPSGHSASAFAFANGVSGEMPELAVPLRLAAAAVAWSRIHTGVHYPGDVVTGALVGGAVGESVGWLRRRRDRRLGRL
jgi:membrane-associated phospholipid phosphatase